MCKTKDNFMCLLISGYSYFCKDWLTITFGFIAMVAWISNALNNTKFDITQLQGIYATLKVAILTEHGIDSKYNSQPGSMPEKKC